jgi:hypothetical protein
MTPWSISVIFQDEAKSGMQKIIMAIFDYQNRQ